MYLFIYLFRIYSYIYIYIYSYVYKRAQSLFTISRSDRREENPVPWTGLPVQNMLALTTGRGCCNPDSLKTRLKKNKTWVITLW